MIEDPQKLTDEELEKLMTSWTQQGHEISSFFIDQHGNPVEVRKFHKNVLPDYIIALAKARGLLLKNNQ